VTLLAPTPATMRSTLADVERPARLDVGVIGAGRAGSVIGACLAQAGHHVVAASAVSDASRERAELLLPTAEIVDARGVASRSSLLILGAPDDALTDLVRGLVATDSIRPGTFVVHLSGRFGTGVLEPATRAGALPMALHPAMTFAGTPEDVQRVGGCCFGVTVPEALWLGAAALVLEMGAEPVRIDEHARPLYHAALAHGSNHLVTLVAQAMGMLAEAGVPDPARMLAPLAGTALDNTLRRGDGALTGPVSRGDAGTVLEHVRALGALDDDVRDAYIALARATTARTLQRGVIDAATADVLYATLADPRASDA
jgi:predicted short-subunit dehydrogenase-like oxidoreductase (DUF2520 family)